MECFKLLKLGDKIEKSSNSINNYINIECSKTIVFPCPEPSKVIYVQDSSNIFFVWGVISFNEKFLMNTISAACDVIKTFSKRSSEVIPFNGMRNENQCAFHIGSEYSTNAAYCRLGVCTNAVRRIIFFLERPFNKFSKLKMISPKKGHCCIYLANPLLWESLFCVCKSARNIITLFVGT